MQARCVFRHTVLYIEYVQVNMNLPVPKAHVASSETRAMRKYILIHLEYWNKHISFIMKCVVCFWQFYVYIPTVGFFTQFFFQTNAHARNFNFLSPTSFLDIGQLYTRTNLRFILFMYCIFNLGFVHFPT